MLGSDDFQGWASCASKSAARVAADQSLASILACVFEMIEFWSNVLDVSNKESSAMVVAAGHLALVDTPNSNSDKGRCEAEWQCGGETRVELKGTAPQGHGLLLDDVQSQFAALGRLWACLPEMKVNLSMLLMCDLTGVATRWNFMGQSDSMSHV